jgi:hypothetical protein
MNTLMSLRWKILQINCIKTLKLDGLQSTYI